MNAFLKFGGLVINPVVRALSWLAIRPISARSRRSVIVEVSIASISARASSAASPRPIYFVMDHRIFSMPVLGWLFRLAKAIPIAPRSEDPAAYEAAFEAAAKVLRQGDLLAIFPEGGITRNGELQPFKGGIMKILENARRDGLTVPVIPMALTNLWGSFFSRVEQVEGEQVAMFKPFRRGLWSRVGLNAGAALVAGGGAA